MSYAMATYLSGGTEIIQNYVPRNVLNAGFIKGTEHGSGSGLQSSGLVHAPEIIQGDFRWICLGPAALIPWRIMVIDYDIDGKNTLQWRLYRVNNAGDGRPSDYGDYNFSATSFTYIGLVDR